MTKMFTPFQELAQIVRASFKRNFTKDEEKDSCSYLEALLAIKYDQPEYTPRAKLFSEVGKNKKIFSANIPGSEIIAVAAPMYREYDLKREYDLLKKLHEAHPEYFAKPIFYFSEEGCAVFGMEMFEHDRLKVIKNRLDPQEEETLVFDIGYALGRVFERTGMYTEDPNENNILALEKEEEEGFEVKLIDTDHYTEGDIQDLYEAFGNVNQICNQYWDTFKDGIYEGRETEPFS